MKIQNNTAYFYQNNLISVFKKNSHSFFIGLSVFALFGFLGIKTIAENTFSIKDNTVFKEIRTVQDKKIPTTYIVQEGDDIWKISEKVYGSGEHAYDIAGANTISDPNVIFEGQTLILPSISPFKENGQISSISTKRVIIKGNEYTVKEGDALWKIAEDAYGDRNMMGRIIEANNLKDMNDIFPGKILKLPRK